MLNTENIFFLKFKLLILCPIFRRLGSAKPDESTTCLTPATFCFLFCLKYSSDLNLLCPWPRNQESFSIVPSLFLCYRVFESQDLSLHMYFEYVLCSCLSVLSHCPNIPVYKKYIFLFITWQTRDTIPLVTREVSGVSFSSCDALITEATFTSFAFVRAFKF